MDEKIVKVLFLVLIVSFVGALVYKAMSPNDYKHPRHRSR